MIRRLLRWSRNLVFGALLVLVTIVLVYALQARRLPDLQPWHTQASDFEVHAAEIDAGMTLDEYRAREAALFADTRRMLEASIPADQQVPGNRYWSGSPNYQWNFPHDWNRTFERVPDEVRGGALLLHGLTDSPYSMRAIADLFAAQGFYVLALRVPGHGTVPAELERSKWQDWMAAARLGARAVRQRIGAEKPFVMVGYSNGAALTVLHQLDALQDSTLPRADKIVLMSAMIGISPAAALARLLDALTFVPYFAKSAWTDVQPEFNPFKYNSFPLNGAIQTRAVTEEISREVEQLQAGGRLADMPPILAFQSVLDTTVRTEAVVDTLFDHLSANGSELVLFDLNRLAAFSTVITPADREFLSTLFRHEARPYRLTVITNANPETRSVIEKVEAAGSTEVVDAPLDLEYPPGVFSLSHIALPFPLDDPLYGLQPDQSESYGLRLGTLALHGERDALLVPIGQLARISSNPFFPYLKARTLAWLSLGD
jgi:alpha-beta hydrolase superfamily lysophospholipase